MMENDFQRVSHHTRPEQSSTHTAGKKTLLGSLGRLPLEIRKMVYAECHSSSRSYDDQKPQYSAQMLRVSTAVYFEYLASLQHRSKSSRFSSLRLRVDPAVHPSRVQILTVFGRPYSLIDAASSHLQFNINPIRRMPIGSFRKMELEIYAPDPTDPGQAIRLCKQISAVITSLSPCWLPSTESAISSRENDCLFPLQMKAGGHSFPTLLDIKFKEGPERSWKKGGRWNASLPDYDRTWEVHESERGGDYYTDVGSVLLLLQQVRDISLYPRASAISDYLRELSRLKTHFGVDRPNGHMGSENERVAGYGSDIPIYQFKFSDSQIHEHIQSLRVWHDYLLDDMPGRSASLLRQERFEHWCRAYEKQHAQALETVSAWQRSKTNSLEQSYHCLAGAHRRISHQLWKLIRSSFHSRFWAMKTYGLSTPDGVTRRSENQSWTEFRKRPVIHVDAVRGRHVASGEKRQRGRRWIALLPNDCVICQAEEHRNREIFAETCVQKKLEILSASWTLENPGASADESDTGL